MGNFQGGQNSFQRPMQSQFQNNRGQGQFQRNQVNPQNNPTQLLIIQGGGIIQTSVIRTKMH